VITGANSAVGQNLIQYISQSSTIVPTRIRAVVRDVSRADGLRPLAAEIIEVNFHDPASLREAVEGAEALVHLPGTLWPRNGESLWDANSQPAIAVIEALKSDSLKSFVYLSHPGADHHSKNGFLQAKGIAEQVILGAGFPGSILRVPMILGQGNQTLDQIIRETRRPISPVISGGATQVQPVSQTDIVAAITWAISAPLAPMRTFYITGPETITYADLLNRVARKLDKRPKILSVPRFLARLVGWALGAKNYSAAIGTNFTEHLDKRQEPREVFPFTLAPVNETLDRIFPMA
jgi:uncharacterized protein YbjT (DUF2867 family)